MARGEQDKPDQQAAIFTSEAPTATDLDRIWEVDANTLADLYAEPLGMERQEYMDGLPHFFAQPEGYRGRFDIPVIVQTADPERGLTIARMHDIVGIRADNWGPDLTRDWERDPSGFVTPRTYATWVSDGSATLGLTPAEVRASLAPDERAGTIFDGLGLYVKDRGILDRRFLLLPGSQVGDVDHDHAPSLRLSKNVYKIPDGPQSGAYYTHLKLNPIVPEFLGAKPARYGSVTAGRRVEVGNRVSFAA